jgi:hypothetical protein
MSTLTNLSDAELDAVNGGFFNTTVVVTKIASNVALQSNQQTNVGILQALVGQGGGQINSANQVAIA